MKGEKLIQALEILVSLSKMDIQQLEFAYKQTNNPKIKKILKKIMIDKIGKM